jgi:hypothetical protein
MSKEELPKYPIYINAFEGGVMLGRLWEKKELIPDVIKQLISLQEKFRKEAGVTITELGNDIIKLEDKLGNVIIRKKYDWEK